MPTKTAKQRICDECQKTFPDDGTSTICRECVGPDWSGKCENCGMSPIVPVTGMCGPCTWGEAETIGGNW